MDTGRDYLEYFFCNDLVAFFIIMPNFTEGK